LDFVLFLNLEIKTDVLLFFLRVGIPFVILPQGLTEGRPPEVLPSPPP
jgi:hypothetical protein